MADFSGLRLVIFRVGDLACAASAGAVREILPAQPATRIPGAQKVVRGLINVRGRLIPVVDGRRALNHPPGDDDGPILLLDIAERSVGFAVDAVLDLFSVSADELAHRGELPGVDPGLVLAVGRRADVSFVYLDMEALLRPILTA